MSSAKAIVVMIDGISAIHFAKWRHFLPHLDALANTGLQVTDGVTPELAGVSMPGRASIIASVPTAEHGIYANQIWDGQEQVFRWSNPYDVRCHTLPELAKAQGKYVASIGYGMIRPEDCTTYIGPWWAGDMLRRYRQDQPYPSDQAWLRASQSRDEQGLLRALQVSGLPIATTAKQTPGSNQAEKMQQCLLADSQLLDIGMALISSDKAPDLLFLEVGMPDYYMHQYGQFSDFAELSIRYADGLIGNLLAQLEAANKIADYHLVILSDHGHCALPDALYVNNVLPAGTQWVGEGSVLYVARQNDKQARQVVDSLAVYGIEPWSQHHIPQDQQHHLMTFMAPQDSNISFEASPANAAAIWGPSKYQSNHGLRPGRPEDYRFFIAHGPRVAPQKVTHAQTDQVAQTIAALVDVKTPWLSKAIGVLQ